MMKNKLSKTALALGALMLGVISTPCTRAGTEIIQDGGGRDFQPAYRYAPPPLRPIYYAPPPPLGVVVYPHFGYYPHPLRVYPYHRVYRHYYYRHWR